MSDDVPDAVMAAAATMATLKAVLRHIEKTDKAGFASVLRELEHSTKGITSTKDAAFNANVYNRALNLFFSPDSGGHRTST